MLHHIADVEGYPLFLSAGDREVVPESVPSCVGVDSEEEVVFGVVDFDCAVEVTALEVGVELDLLLLSQGGVDPFEGSVVEGVLLE